MNNKFDWGETAKISDSAPPDYCPGEFVSICGLFQITTQKDADQLSCKNGEWIYLIEYGDGSAIEVPESCLEAYSRDKSIKK